MSTSVAVPFDAGICFELFYFIQTYIDNTKTVYTNTQAELIVYFEEEKDTIYKIKKNKHCVV